MHCARKLYTEAPIVQNSVGSFKHTGQSTSSWFGPAVTHRTSTMSNWRNIVAMDTPKEKAANIS